MPRTHENEDSLELNLSPTSTDRFVTDTLKKSDIRTKPSKFNYRSPGIPEDVRTSAISKPGKGRNSGGNQKSTKRSHDAQK
jgi:hypothetical protein